MNKIRNVLIKKKHISAHCAYLTRPRRIKKKQAGLGCVTFCPTFYDSAIILKKSELCKKKGKKNNQQEKYRLDLVSNPRQFCDKKTTVRLL